MVIQLFQVFWIHNEIRNAWKREEEEEKEEEEEEEEEEREEEEEKEQEVQTGCNN